MNRSNVKEQQLCFHSLKMAQFVGTIAKYKILSDDQMSIFKVKVTLTSVSQVSISH